jgi:hypothetical protein
MLAQRAANGREVVVAGQRRGSDPSEVVRKSLGEIRHDAFRN